MLISLSPLVFISQMRAFKAMDKHIYYFLCLNTSRGLVSIVTGLFLSLLSAPQQAVLTLNEEEARAALYGPVDKEESMQPMEDDEEESEDDMEEDDDDDEYDEEE